MHNAERVVYSLIAAFVCGGAIALAFYALGVRWGDGWSKAASFAVFAAVLWITWIMTKPVDKQPHG